MMPSERNFLRRLPKAELHLHLEGSVPPALLWQFAERQGCPHDIHSIADVHALYEIYDFDRFIHAIKTVSLLLQTPQDYAQVVDDLAATLAADGVVYAEVFVSIGILLWRRVAVEPFWEAIEAARRRAEAATGVQIRWLFDAVRQFGAAHLEAVLDYALRWQPEGAVIGIGIGGDEGRGPASQFVAGYARAAAAGLRRTVHAGETCGAASVRAAIELLGAERIGHGLRSFEDPSLVAELAARRICLDMCPTSNLKTGSWPDELPTPALAYLRQGVPVTINSDDPAIFGCSLLAEYISLVESEQFSLADVVEVTRNSFIYSFLPQNHKQMWCSRLEAQFAAFSRSRT